MSWYRKYRPVIFSDLVGQDHIRKILLSTLQKEKPAHAYIFSGPRGTGKTSTARIFGKALNCLRPTREGEPCNSCSNCEEINTARFVDLIEIDAASNTGVDHIRDLRDKIGFSPTSGKAKVYIIDEVHMLSLGAFNALLKTLEEPPSFVYFILATTEIHKVPETIQSRCQHFAFRRIVKDDIMVRLRQIGLKENIQFDEESLEIFAMQSGGGLRDAISLFEQYASSGEVHAESLRSQMGLVPDTLVEEFFIAIFQKTTESALKILDKIGSEGFSLTEFTRNFLLFLRKKLLEAVERNEGLQEILREIDIFDEAQRNMKFAVIPQLPLEVAVVCATKFGGEGERKDVSRSSGIFGIFGGGEKKPEIPEPLKKPEQKNSIQTQVEKLTVLDEVKGGENKDLPKKKTAAFLAPELTLENIKQAWPQILEKLSGALLRMALRNAEISAIQGNTLTLRFPASTWKDQVEKTQNMQEFLAAFEEVFSRKIEIESVVTGVQLEPTVVESSKKQKEEEWNPLEAFQEIMGGKAKKVEKGE
ncbi:DNA polymerase III subunit gamma/tau [Candidatus Peregrinibacteria bacterium]|nr:DNA polymerase III subunit gamma/tau [Candidatus Peregrinibacteria bacterium]